MSRIGNKQLNIPSDIQVQIEGQNVKVKGPKGELTLLVHPDIVVKLENSILTVAPKSADHIEKPTRALWGTMRQLIANMVIGVKDGYQKKLEIEGVGYKAGVQGTTLVLDVGFTEPIKLEIPKGITVQVEKNVIVVVGIKKEEVGQFSASVRKARPVEPYKGKGIRYQGEVVRRKLGKRAAATTGGTGAK